MKELGIAFYNCSSVADDLGKIFDVYWTVGNETSLPGKWSDDLSTSYNSKNPFILSLNERKTTLYISVNHSFSPPALP